jgi:hypothetical protein
LLGLNRFFSFLILYTVGRAPWTGDQPVARPIRTHRTTHCGIRTHDRSVQPSEHSSCFTPRGHCDRPRHQNAAQNHDIKIGNRCFENVAQFRYLGTNQLPIQDEIKRPNSGNACYHSVQKLLSYRLLCRNIKKFCTVVKLGLYRLSVFENRVLRIIF